MDYYDYYYYNYYYCRKEELVAGLNMYSFLFDETKRMQKILSMYILSSLVLEVKENTCL